MKILLDESLPIELKTDITGHETYTVREMAWTSIKNGILLRLMLDEKFEVLITRDQSLPKQQNLKRFGIAVVILMTKSARTEVLRPMIPVVLGVLPNLKPGMVIEISESTQDNPQPPEE